MTQFLFDREHEDHPWASSFQQVEAQARKAPHDFRDVSHRVLCDNWRMDYRVATDREAHMVAFQPELARKQWLTWLSQYFGSHLCRPAAPKNGAPRSVYLESFNDSNRIGHLQAHDELIHANSLTAMLFRLRTQNEAFWLRLEALVPGILRLQRIKIWNDFFIQVKKIGHKLQSAPRDTIQQLAALLCEGLGETQPPWFAAFADEVAPALREGRGAEFCKALGLGHIPSGDWLLAWRYTGLQAGPIYRPTVVEANDSPFHYPSPPTAEFGLTMSLDPAEGASREVIHAPLTSPMTAEFCTGKLYLADNALGVNAAWLQKLRQAHRDRLREEYRDQTDLHWIDRHSSA